MPDTKISALTIGDPAQVSDAIAIARAGGNFQVSAGSIALLASKEIKQLIVSDSSFTPSLLSPTDSGIEVHQTGVGGGTIALFRHGSGVNSQAYILALHSRGTKDVPLTLQSGDYYAQFGFGGYDGTIYTAPSYILVQTSENWDATHHGNNMQFNVVPAATEASTEVLRLGAVSGPGNALSNSSLIHFSLLFGQVLGWANNTNTAADVGISRLGSASLALGNGTQGDYSGSLKLNFANVFGAGQVPVSGDGSKA